MGVWKSLKDDSRAPRLEGLESREDRVRCKLEDPELRELIRAFEETVSAVPPQYSKGQDPYATFIKYLRRGEISSDYLGPLRGIKDSVLQAHLPEELYRSLRTALDK